MMHILKIWRIIHICVYVISKPIKIVIYLKNQTRCHHVLISGDVLSDFNIVFLFY